MEKKTEVKSVKIELMCDICKEKMEEDKSKILLSNPPKRTYVCKNNHTVTSTEVYPRIDFEELTFAEMISKIF